MRDVTSPKRMNPNGGKFRAYATCYRVSPSGWCGGTHTLGAHWHRPRDGRSSGLNGPDPASILDTKPIHLNGWYL